MTNNNTTTVTKDSIELSSNRTSSNLEYTRAYDSISRVFILDDYELMNNTSFNGNLTMDHGLPIIRPTLLSLVASCQHALVSVRQGQQQQQRQLSGIDPLLLFVPPFASFFRTPFDADYTSPCLLSDIIDEALQMTTATDDGHQLFRR